MIPRWLIDGWVKCPACGRWVDATVVFGDVPDPLKEDDAIGIKDGTVGKCDSCDAKITIRLETA